MNKRLTKKLTLRAETIRSIAMQELRAAAGGLRRLTDDRVACGTNVTAGTCLTCANGAGQCA